MDLHKKTDPTTIAPILTLLEQTFLKASEKGELKLFQECLKKGVNCNVANEHGYTSLHYICAGGHYQLLRLILKDNAIDVNKTDENGDTPLHCAMRYLNRQTPALHAILIASLIQKGAKVNAQNNALETPLSTILSIFAQNALAIEILIEHGADITMTLALPNPSKPIIKELIFEKAIRTAHHEYLLAVLKATKGITKSMIIKGLILTKFGYNNPNWGNSLWPNALHASTLKNYFKKMGQILMQYFITMQGLGFATKPTQDKKSEWEANRNSAPFPLEIAKTIAWYSVKDIKFSIQEKKSLTILFGAQKLHVSKLTPSHYNK